MEDVLLRLTGKSAYGYEIWPVLFDKVLNHLHNRGKNLNIRGEGFNLILKQVKTHDFTGTNLWSNGKFETLQEERFRHLTKVHPEAIMQCPIDFLVPLICSAPLRVFVH